MDGIRIIRDASYAVMCLCGKQKYDYTLQYRLSDFVFRCKIGGSSLYYSCLTGELVEVTKQEMAFQYLVKHWFYVEKGLVIIDLRYSRPQSVMQIVAIVMNMVSNKCQ